MMLPIVMEYNQDATGDKFKYIAEAMGVDTTGMDQAAYRKAAIDAVRQLSVPRTPAPPATPRRPAWRTSRRCSARSCKPLFRSSAARPRFSWGGPLFERTDSGERLTDPGREAILSQLNVCLSAVRRKRTWN